MVNYSLQGEEECRCFYYVAEVKEGEHWRTVSKIWGDWVVIGDWSWVGAFIETVSSAVALSLRLVCLPATVKILLRMARYRDRVSRFQFHRLPLHSSSSAISDNLSVLLQRLYQSTGRCIVKLRVMNASRDALGSFWKKLKPLSLIDNSDLIRISNKFRYLSISL